MDTSDDVSMERTVLKLPVREVCEPLSEPPYTRSQVSFAKAQLSLAREFERET